MTVPPTFFVGGKEDGGDPVGVVVILGDRMVRVGNCWCKDPLDPENAPQIPGVELVPLREPGELGKPVPREATSPHSPLAVLAFRNARAIATFMEALDRVEKKLTGEMSKVVVQYEKPLYPRVDVGDLVVGEHYWYCEPELEWQVVRVWIKDRAKTSLFTIPVPGDWPVCGTAYGKVRQTKDMPGSWFGPVSPPEDWK